MHIYDCVILHFKSPAFSSFSQRNIYYILNLFSKMYSSNVPTVLKKHCEIFHAESLHIFALNSIFGVEAIPYNLRKNNSLSFKFRWHGM